MMCRRVFLIWTLGTIVSAGQNSTRADDGKAIRDVFALLVKTWNNHDMKTHCSVFAQDADFVNVNGYWWQGRPEIERQHTTAHQTVFKSTEASISPRKVRMVKPDVAVVQAGWRVTGDVRSKNPRDYIMTYVLNKQGRDWLIVSAQNASAEDRSQSSHALNVNLATPASYAETYREQQTAVRPDETAIVNALSESNAAWSKGDIHAAAEVYGTDADFVSTRAEWFQGRADIERYFSSLRKEAGQVVVRTSDVLKVRFLHPDTAVVTERWRINSADQSRSPVSGFGLLVVKAQGKAWKIVAAENTITRGTPPATSPK